MSLDDCPPAPDKHNAEYGSVIRRLEHHGQIEFALKFWHMTWHRKTLKPPYKFTYKVSVLSDY